MPTLRLRFPAGRYHATPWGHHVNEGMIEWPPSPWRLLRALVACGFSTQHWLEVPNTARRLVDNLSATLPLFQLPQASTAHSRHFMPIGTLTKGREQTTLVFDTWADVGDGEMLIHWPCELDAEESALLDQLARALGYLGRSESWIDVDSVSDNDIMLARFTTVPCRDGLRPDEGFEQVSLMAAIPSAEYDVWRRQQSESTLAAFPLPEGKKKPTAKLLKDRERAVAPYPANLLNCLMTDTSQWKSHGWSQPPGSRRVLYWRPCDALQVSAPIKPKRQPAAPVEMMLLALSTPSGNRSALPSITRTLPQAELFHRALICRAANGSRINCPSLTGKDRQGRPLRDDHRHAHTVPLDLDGDQHIDHILVYATGGLCGIAQRAIRDLRRTWTKGGGSIQVALVAHGPLDLLRRLPGKFLPNVESLLGRKERARIWESDTPFVPPRFPKSRGKNTLIGQIIAEVASRAIPEPEHIEIDPRLTRDLRHFVRARSRGRSSPPIDAGFGVRLVFPEPVAGPLLLGYGAHFGLGRFRAVAN